jgi:hypothetical protein
MKKDAIIIRPTTDDGRQTTVSAEAAELAHNRYHRAARSSAAMAIVYAAMAGRELIEKRKGIKHGGWLKWVEKNCEFSDCTAWRYMSLAEQLKGKIVGVIDKSCSVQDLIGRTKFEAIIQLLDRPPSELLPAETEKLLADIRAATEGQTLRQLYFDFGLATPPKPVGGANHLHAFLKEAYPNKPEYLEKPLDKLPKEVQAAWKKHLREKDPNDDTEAFLANDTWKILIRHLREECLEKKTYALLPRAMIETIYGTFIDVKRELQEVLKK